MFGGVNDDIDGGVEDGGLGRNRVGRWRKRREKRKKEEKEEDTSSDIGAQLKRVMISWLVSERKKKLKINGRAFAITVEL